VKAPGLIRKIVKFVHDSTASRLTKLVSNDYSIICMYVCMYVLCMYIYIYTHTHKHTYIHIYIHTDPALKYSWDVEECGLLPCATVCLKLYSVLPRAVVCPKVYNVLLCVVVWREILSYIVICWTMQWAATWWIVLWDAEAYRLLQCGMLRPKVCSVLNIENMRQSKHKYI